MEITITSDDTALVEKAAKAAYSTMNAQCAADETRRKHYRICAWEELREESRKFWRDAIRAAFATCALPVVYPPATGYDGC